MKKNKIIINIINIILIKLIRLYQIFISPMIGNNCRFLPTCSEYTIECLKLYGPFKGFIISVKRISSCHPFGKKGYDPVMNKMRIKQ